MSKILPIAQSPPDPQTHTHPSEISKNIKPEDLEGLNVVFINMPLRENSRPTATPEGPLLMATNLRDNYGVTASIIDLNAYRIKDETAQKQGLKDGRWLTQRESYELIKKHFEVHGEPDVVGLSGMITTLGAYKGKDVAKQREVARMIRGELAPDSFLVSGNGLATELKTGLFNYIPELDAIAHSEGDDVILKICLDAKNIKKMGMQNAINSGKLAPYYLNELGGRQRFMYAGERPSGSKKGILPDLPFADLSFLEKDVFGEPVLSWIMNTPAWSASVGTSSATPWKDEDLVPKANSVSSRGCPFVCFYCFRGSQGERLWGVRTAKHLRSELIALIAKYGIKFMVYPDDNFAVAIDRIEDMVPLFKELGVRYGTHTRMDEGADPRRIKPMSESGCVYIGFGPESAHPDTLEAIGKGGHTLSMGFESIKVNGIVYDRIPKSMTMAIRNCLNYGIHPNCTWIMGSPTETLERLKQTVAFIKYQEYLYELHNIPASAVNKRIFSMTWYPGTELIKYEKVQKELKRVFGLNLKPTSNPRCPVEPVCDDNFLNYLLELDDATKLLVGPDGEPLNFSEMSNDALLQAREYVDSDQIDRILDM
ncbi:MAG: radical SAM protein [Candidatus Yanofskybacteria bacterium]|nr:radical SAM protein [Candidatus Yanofskybacteria bacterium]